MTLEIHCSKCCTYKLPKDFCIRKHLSTTEKVIYEAYCRKCKQISNKIWQNKNKIKIIAYGKKYRNKKKLMLNANLPVN